jgi:hypothetical protein
MSATEPTIWLSHSDDFENFQAGVLDADSYEVTIKSTEEIMWVESLEKLFVGTGADEWLVSANKLDSILTPTNTTPRKHSSYGSSYIQPLNMLDSLLFIDSSGQAVREITYEDKNSKDDLSLLAEHITKAGIKSWCVQEGVETIVWCFLKDLTAVTLTYDPTEKIKAWAKQPMSGDCLTGCVIPGPEEDNLYLGMGRTINGSDVIYIEKMASWDFDDITDCFYVDCGIVSGASSENDVSITSATNALPIVVSATGHGFADGDTITITGVTGMTELNGNNYLVSDAATDTFTLKTLAGIYVDGVSFAAGTGGTATTYTVSGLDHLISETVSILADGVAQNNKVVTAGGTITTDSAVVTKANIGLAYTSLLQPFRLVIMHPRGGTSYMSDVKLSKLMISLYNSGYVEQSSDNVTYWPIDLTNINWTNTSDITGLLTADVEATSDSGFDSLNPIYIRSSKPLPLTVRAIVAKMDVTA